MLKILIIISLIYSLLTSVSLAQVEIYKCKNSDGVVNFRSIPCGEKERGIKHSVKKIELNPDGTKKTRKQIIEDRLKKEKEFLEATKRQREDEKIKKDKLERHRKKLFQNCQKARKDLHNYQRSGYLYTKEKNGKRNVLSDAEKEKAETDAKRRITYWCRQ